MKTLDDYKLTEISETLKAVKGINEVYAGELMLYHAITEHTASNYQLMSILERMEGILSSIEMDLRKGQ